MLQVIARSLVLDPVMLHTMVASAPCAFRTGQVSSCIQVTYRSTLLAESA